MDDNIILVFICSNDEIVTNQAIKPSVNLIIIKDVGRVKALKKHETLAIMDVGDHRYLFVIICELPELGGMEKKRNFIFKGRRKRNR